jgi:hypothetical protein
VRLQVLAGLAALPAAQPQPGQQQQVQLPHSHWLYWTLLPADAFPAAAIQSAAGSSQGVLAGACDISCLVRSLVQQLADAVPAAFVMEPARGPARACAPPAAALGAVDSGSAAAPAAAADEDSEGVASSSISQQQQQQSADLQAAAKLIVDRVRASGGSQHAGWVKELLSPMLAPDWRQQQQTFLRVVSTFEGGQALVSGVRCTPSCYATSCTHVLYQSCPSLLSTP